MALSPELEIENMGLVLSSGGIVSATEMVELLTRNTRCVAYVHLGNCSSSFGEPIAYWPEQGVLVFGSLWKSRKRARWMTPERLIQLGGGYCWHFQFIDEPQTYAELCTKIDGVHG